MTIRKHDPQNRARVVAVVGDKFITVKKTVWGYSPRITFPGKQISEVKNAGEEAAEHFRWQTGIHIDAADLHPIVTKLVVGTKTYHIFVTAISTERYEKRTRKRGALARSLDNLYSHAQNGLDLSTTFVVLDALTSKVDSGAPASSRYIQDTELGSCGAHVGPKGNPCTAANCNGTVFR